MILPHDISEQMKCPAFADEAIPVIPDFMKKH